MSTDLERPEWAAQMPEPPQVTRYVGPEENAVRWYDGTSRRCYQVHVNGRWITLNIQQASALAEMLADDLDAEED